MVNTISLTPTENAAPLLRLCGVSKKYNTRDGDTFYALKDVSLDVWPCETVALVGESGSGKSTLAKLALNLAKPDTGWVELAGHRISEMDARELKPFRSKIQPVFQDSSATFNPRRTVRQILEQAMLSTGNTNPAEIKQKSLEILDQMSLQPAEEILKRFPHELSGGQRQRLNIARAICVNPRIIVADEPLSGADVSIRGKVLNLLQEIQDREGIAYLFITHDIAVAQAFAKRIAVMYEGKIVEYGSAEEVFLAPKHSYTKMLIESALLGRSRLDALRQAQEH